jgi:dTDP-4-amino-4,6-dideoxygalactose transaminase
MTIPFVDLAAQYRDHKSEFDAAIAEVISETAFIGTRANRFVQKFEAGFADFSGANHCVGCANGTDALEILLKAAGIGPGDEVVVPALSWIATSEAASNVGAVPVFADVDPLTHTLDPERFREAINERTRAVIPVHLYGQPADMGPILEIAAQHDLFVLEDCAQAHGAEYKGRKVGTMGNAGSFSFFPGKNLGAYGDAGGMITNDEDLAAHARMISQHGQSKRKFEHEIEGRNSRLDGMQAAILSVKLKYLPAWTKRRIEIADIYRQLLADLPLELPVAGGDRRHVYHLFATRTKQRDAVRTVLNEIGVATGQQYPIALPLLEAYSAAGHGPEDFPHAHAMTQQVLTLPVYPEITETQMEFVRDSLVTALRG